MTEKSTKSSTNKTGLQPVSGYVNMSPYFKGWGVGARTCGIKAVQTDRQRNLAQKWTVYRRFYI